MSRGLKYIHAKSTCKVRHACLCWLSLKAYPFRLIRRKYECLYELRKRMLLTITTTYQPATDLGYLLHKNPARVQSFSLSFGKAHIFYPEATLERCTAVLLLDIDAVHLVRGRDRSVALEQYVNDRPYVASSFLSVAISEVLGTALNGRCTSRPELAEARIPLQATLSVVPCRGGEGFLKRLFEPLGYTLMITGHTLDEERPEWGMSSYFTDRKSVV